MKISRSAAVVVGSVIVCLAVGAIGSLATAAAVNSWYATLTKPWFTPPGWIFGPVWTVLYILMGLSLARLLLAARGRHRAEALITFSGQLIFNLLWSPLFFGAHVIAAALVVIVLMWIGIAATIGYAWRVDRPAALLLVPYILWVSFASILNAALWWLN